jgi:hypothetical protein
MQKPASRNPGCACRLPASNPPQVLDQHEQVEWVARLADESEALIIRPRLIIVRMHGEGADAGDVGRLQRAVHRILEEARPPALPPGSNRQAREQHDRHRMASQALGGVLLLKGT